MLRNWWQKLIGIVLILVFIVALLNCKWFLKILYPFPHRELVLNSCEENRMDPFLVLAVIRTESRFYSGATSRAGAQGLMQIMPETGYWIAQQRKISDFSEEKLYQPEYNIPMGIWYLSYLEKSFAGDLPQMLAAYNAGDNKVRKWLSDGTWTGRLQDINQIPYLETRKYIQKVLFDYHAYQKIYQDER